MCCTVIVSALVLVLICWDFFQVSRSVRWLYHLDDGRVQMLVMHSTEIPNPVDVGEKVCKSIGRCCTRVYLPMVEMSWKMCSMFGYHYHSRICKNWNRCILCSVSDLGHCQVCMVLVLNETVPTLTWPSKWEAQVFTSNISTLLIIILGEHQHAKRRLLTPTNKSGPYLCFASLRW